jgi:putative hemolysin
LTTTTPIATDSSSVSTPPPHSEIANPASQNCVEQGGTLTLETRDDGGQYGVCGFEDNRQCEEWALLRGDCPVGGVKVTGYVTDAARYCAITGGTYAVDEEATSSAGEEQGTCTLPDGQTCDVYDYYNGACGDTATDDDGASSGQTSAEAGDPFAYCAEVGSEDSPPGESVDGELPEVIVQAMIEQKMVAADAPPAIQQAAIWRCMDGRVWACVYGANLPCDEKADLSETPSDAMITYCQENAGADIIPAAVTGRATVYSWRCDGETPTIVEQVDTADAQGYLANFWYELTPPQ